MEPQEQEVLAESPVRTCPYIENGPIISWDDKIWSPIILFENSLARVPNNDCFGTRQILPDGTLGDYQWETYAQVGHKRELLGSALYAMGCKKNDRIGIFSKTRAEFALLDLVCQSYGLVSVPIYFTLGPDAIPYIINHSNLRIVFTSKESMATLKQRAPEMCPNLLAIVQFEELTAEERPGPADLTPLPRRPADEETYFYETYDPTNPDTFDKGLEEQTSQAPEGLAERAHIPFPGLEERIAPLRYLNLSELLALGERHMRPIEIPTSDDMFSIMYTSGTTGTPKGVILRHSNIMCTECGGHIAGLCGESNETYYAYLPLAHVFERVAEYAIYKAGARIGFFSGNISEVMKEVQILKPALFVGVPRILNRMYEAFNKGVSEMNFLVRGLFWLAYSQKRRALQKGKSTPFWDRLVFNKVKAKLGGNMRIILSGSAPLSTTVHEFLQIVLGVCILPGYSMTETTCSGAIPKIPNFSCFGNCGPVMTGLEMKLRDVPEMNYTTQGPGNSRGEILMRGPAVFHGYYRDAVQSRQLFTPDGWLQSGDIAEILPNGHVAIIDRKKNIFKLAQGEYVAPEYLEAVYERSPMIEQCFFYGDSLKRYCVSIIVPPKEPLIAWVRKNVPELAQEESYAAMLQHASMQAFIMSEIRDQAAKAKLNSLEIPKVIRLWPEAFPANAVTPSLKLKRYVLKEYFAQTLRELYAAIE